MYLVMLHQFSVLALIFNNFKSHDECEV